MKSSEVDRMNPRIQLQGIDLRIEGIKEVISKSAFTGLIEMIPPFKIGESGGLDRDSHRNPSRSCFFAESQSMYVSSPEEIRRSRS